ncbi:universal stress protein [Aquitalea sp. S1-19]|nr:universal stress protein [Aquitalea sp. S1-19]
MPALERILVTTDFSPLGNAAVRRATRLAARDGAKLLLVHALPRFPTLQAVFVDHGQVAQQMRAAAEAHIGTLLAEADAAGVVDVRGEIGEGAAHRVVADAIETFHPDLVVIGAHGKGLLQQFFLGGTAARILAQSTSPVLVVRELLEADYQHVVAAVDLGPRSPVVLAAAHRVGARAQLTAVYAYTAPFEASLRYKGFPEEDIRRYVEKEAQAAQPRMDALLAASGLTQDARIVYGDINPALPEAVRELGAELIVVGKHGGTRVEEAIMGSVPRFLAYYAPCDVLVC